jgi:histidinol-phosphatase (PHP family)
LKQHDEIQYIVGSVHHVRGVSIDFERPAWLRAVRQSNLQLESTTMIVDPSTDVPVLRAPEFGDRTLEEDYQPSISELRVFLLDYFEAQYEMLQALQPEVVGHFDLCLLWTPNVSLRSEELAGVWEKIKRNVSYVVGYGGLFEANAAAFRKGWETSYPGKDILKVSYTSECDLIADNSS